MRLVCSICNTRPDGVGGCRCGSVTGYHPDDDPMGLLRYQDQDDAPEPRPARGVSAALYFAAGAYVALLLRWLIASVLGGP